MTKFRPCIDLHAGKVKQIVGSSLSDVSASSDVQSPTVVENHVAEESADWFARKYQDDRLTGGHIIKLGPGNDDAAEAALRAYPGGMQIGGGINLENARRWLDAGASHVILTSYLFGSDGAFQFERLVELAADIGRKRIVVDLSCKRVDDGWTVAMNRWQTLTDLTIESSRVAEIGEYCDELLIHAAHVEGLCEGIDQELVSHLASIQTVPMTYAGGVASMEDVHSVDRLSSGSIDVTVGSALDLFGGSGVRYDELVAYSHGGT